MCYTYIYVYTHLPQFPIITRITNNCRKGLLHWTKAKSLASAKITIKNLYWLKNTSNSRPIAPIYL